VLGEREDKRGRCHQKPSADYVEIEHEETRYVFFNKNRWAQFLLLIPQIGEEAKELNRNTCPVTCHQHIRDGFFVPVNVSMTCFDIRKFHIPYELLELGKEKLTKKKLTKNGLALHLDEWAHLLQIVIRRFCKCF